MKWLNRYLVFYNPWRDYLIIKDLVKMMGVTMNISSEKGKGTMVSLYIYTNK